MQKNNAEKNITINYFVHITVKMILKHKIWIKRSKYGYGNNIFHFSYGSKFNKADCLCHPSKSIPKFHQF